MGIDGGFPQYHHGIRHNLSACYSSIIRVNVMPKKTVDIHREDKDQDESKKHTQQAV